MHQSPHAFTDLTIEQPGTDALLRDTLEQARRAAGQHLLKIALVADLPLPSKIPVYERIAAMPGVKLHVIFCSRRAPNRFQDIPPLDFDHTFLRERHFTLKGRRIHHNSDVVSCLRRLRPNVIVTNGFHPTHLYAFGFARMRGIPHVAMTDGTDISEAGLTQPEQALRKFVYARSAAFIAASAGGHRLYQQYDIPSGKCFTSPLCIDNKRFAGSDDPIAARFDFLFCGRLERVKNPLFALDVAIDVARRLNRRVSILFAGSGSMAERIQHIAAQHPSLVQVAFAGFTPQDQLPALYRSARILLFPTRWDPWSMQVNEACATGLPVIASPHAGVAGELVIDKENGYVRELDLDAWGKAAASLLTQSDMLQRFSRRSRSLVADFTFDKAADGIVAACRHAFSVRGRGKAGASGRPRIVIVERQLLHYRVAVYERLREVLDKEGVDLQLLIGEGTPSEKQKKDEVELDWTVKIPTRYFVGNRICWQPFGDYARDADMVIVMHENKLLYNLWLMSFGRPRRLAFWGHGRNMQSDRPDGWKEKFKRWTINKVDWWFAYTDSSALLVTRAGFPRARTTVVDNAVDTREMTAQCNAVTEQDCRRMRADMGIGDGKIGLFVGSLYKDKRLDFLLNAAKYIRQRVPDFHLLVVGAGPDQGMIEDAAREHPWIHYLGPLHGEAKARMLALADVMLNPGLVGLGILDSFVSGSPMFTTDCGLHSPEISYMESGVNGVMTDDDMTQYANAVVHVMNHPAELQKLKQGALATASRYTAENMVNRLCNGILACIAST